MYEYLLYQTPNNIPASLTLVGLIDRISKDLAKHVGNGDNRGIKNALKSAREMSSSVLAKNLSATFSPKLSSDAELDDIASMLIRNKQSYYASFLINYLAEVWK